MLPLLAAVAASGVMTVIVPAPTPGAPLSAQGFDISQHALERAAAKGCPPQERAACLARQRHGLEMMTARWNGAGSNEGARQRLFAILRSRTVNGATDWETAEIEARSAFGAGTDASEVFRANMAAHNTERELNEKIGSAMWKAHEARRRAGRFESTCTTTAQATGTRDSRTITTRTICY